MLPEAAGHSVSNEINVVVTCTERKRRAPSRALQFRSLAKSSKRSAWTQRLEQDPSDAGPAIDLYAGDHWTVVRGLDQVVRKSGARLQLWVCSAGYGLIPANAPVKAYSATFSAHKPDSVIARTALSRRQWWSELADWRGPSKGQPRTLAALAARFPKAPLLFAGSDRYLDAVEDDLMAALDELRSSELLTIFSTGAKPSRGLADHLAPSSARLKPALGGGSMHSLNVRLLRHAIAALTPERLRSDEVARLFQRLLKGAPEMPVHDRKPMTDDDLRSFIRAEFKKNARAKHSPLLRLLRDSGRACEQKRFAEIFKQVKAEVGDAG